MTVRGELRIFRSYTEKCAGSAGGCFDSKLISHAGLDWICGGYDVTVRGELRIFRSYTDTPL